MMNKWYLLEEGDIIDAGDESYNPHNGTWQPVCSGSIGNRWNTGYYPFRRKVENTEIDLDMLERILQVLPGLLRKEQGELAKMYCEDLSYNEILAGLLVRHLQKGDKE